MDSETKGTTIMIALFGAIPAALLVTLGVWLLLLNVNDGAALNTGQAFQAMFAGFAFGLALFSALCACNLTIK